MWRSWRRARETWWWVQGEAGESDTGSGRERPGNQMVELEESPGHQIYGGTRGKCAGNQVGGLKETGERDGGTGEEPGN